MQVATKEETNINKKEHELLALEERIANKEHVSVSVDGLWLKLFLLGKHDSKRNSTNTFLEIFLIYFKDDNQFVSMCLCLIPQMNITEKL